MSRVTVLFGTETGNAEMVAEDIAALLNEQDLETEVLSMEDVDLDELETWPLLVLVSSTYGEGELPSTAVDFHAALRARTPDLSAIRFAAFGLGDSGYETYNNGIATLIETFTALGATQLGDTGFHDAASGSDAAECAVSWASEALVAGLLVPVGR